MMMDISFRPALAVMVPLIASVLIIAIGEKVRPNVREGITLVASVLLAICVYSMIPAVLAGDPVQLDVIEIVKGVTFAFNVDAAGMLFACVSSTLWILTSVYSIGYMRGHGEINQTGYFSAFAMCITGTIGLCFAGNMLTFFIFYEVLTVATYPLVVHYRDEEGKASGRKYLAYTLTSGQIFFAGMVILYFISGTMDFIPGGFVTPEMMSKPGMFILFFMLIGAGIVKAGVIPFHSWLPAAMVAPTPVSALLHAVAVVKAGAFCTLRIVLYVFGPAAADWCGGAQTLAWMAVITILVSSLIAIRKDNLKARLAFSTIGQLSYIVLGIAIMTSFAMTGALYHIVAHAFMKITLFMAAGAIFVTTHKKDISQMVGIGRRMPYTMVAFTLASVGIAGFPFFVGFVSKANILMGTAQANQPLFAVTLIASALLALTYLMPISYTAFKTKVVNPEFSQYGEASYSMLIPLCITALISIILGIYPNAGLHLYDLANMASASVFGM